MRVDRPEDLASAFEEAKKLMAEFRVPVLVEVILERVTNVFEPKLDGWLN